MNKKKIKNILKKDLFDILKLSQRVFKKYNNKNFDLCSIINAKSGACSEDCKFCAQSSYHSTFIEKYGLLSKEKIINEAMKAQENGAGHFGLVTSGRGLSDREIKKIAEIIHHIKSTLNVEPCASLGALNEDQLIQLKQAGLNRYHHNIETSPSFYNNIVSTHDFNERLNTIKNVKKVGMEICSGGIIGLGESMDDRIDMAFLLKELDVDAVPLNILVPIKGIPLADQEPLSILEIIKTIALFRFILKDKTIKIAAGRESILKDFQSLTFLAGANGMIIGGYLTIKGRSIDDDLQMTKQLLELL